MQIRPLWFGESAASSIASARGLFDDVALDVAARNTRSSDQQYEELLSGDCDLVVTSMDNVIAWNQRGDADDFRIIGQIERTTRLTLWGRPGFQGIRPGITTPALVDSPDNGFVIVLRAIMAEEGLSGDLLPLIPAGGVMQRFDALLAGSGDITLLGPPVDIHAAAAGAKLLAVVNDRYPVFPGQGIVARSARFAELGDVLPLWLAQLDIAARWAKAEPDNGRAALIARGIPPAALDVLIDSLPDSLTPDRA
jgi:ABC-type nitrate/sulfonate/bicarbonate transport system substrate-binding protein